MALVTRKRRGNLSFEVAYVGHCANCVRIGPKDNERAMRVFSACSSCVRLGLWRKPLRVCMLQHARGTGRPERTSRNHSAQSCFGGGGEARKGGLIADQQFRNTRNDLSCVSASHGLHVLLSGIKRMRRMKQVGHAVDRRFLKVWEISSWTEKTKQNKNMIIPNLKNLRSPWWSRRGRSGTLFPTGAHYWRLRESHLRRTSLKPHKFWVSP